MMEVVECDLVMAGEGGDDDDDDDDLWRAMAGGNAIAMTMTGGAVGGVGGGGRGRIVCDDDDEYDNIRHRCDGSIGRRRNLDSRVRLLAAPGGVLYM